MPQRRRRLPLRPRLWPLLLPHPSLPPGRT